MGPSGRRDFLRRSARFAAAATIAPAAFPPMGPASAQIAKGVTGLWVVELFTSQGCSSCPPADANLGILARRPELLALSFHVDYWDHIGWKDPFASPAFTERQRAYAKSLRQRYVYTPETVVHGMAHDPGTDAAKVERMLAEAKRAAQLRLDPSLVRRPDGGLVVAVEAAPSGLAGPVEIWLATFDRTHVTQVARGENRGKSLTNHNVVRSIERLALWDGRPASWPVEARRIAPGRSVAVLAQRAECGPMIGAARLDG